MADQKEFKKKGGTLFPKYSLGEVIERLNRFVEKTHTGTIDLAELNSGVFGLKAKSSSGKIRLSAMRQFGLASGINDKLKASGLAKQISVNKEGQERESLLQQAFFSVKSFSDVFSTFSGDTVTLDKVAVYAVTPVGVHPANKDSFAEIFAKSAEACNLGKVDGNSISLFKKPESTGDESEVSQELDEKQMEIKKSVKEISGTKPEITIKIDSTLDSKKLEEQLKLLRDYGLI